MQQVDVTGLRSAMRGLKQSIPKSELIKRCKRAMPSEWVKYSTSSSVYKIIRDSKPSVLYDRLEGKRMTWVRIVFLTTRPTEWGDKVSGIASPSFVRSSIHGVVSKSKTMWSEC